MRKHTWYSAKSVVRIRFDSELVPKDNFCYEERVVLFWASSFEEALGRAEAEAVIYARDHNAVFINYIDCHELAADTIGDGIEVYSLMRTSVLNDEAFVGHYFDDGTQHSGRMEG